MASQRGWRAQGDGLVIKSSQIGDETDLQTEGRKISEPHFAATRKETGRASSFLHIPLFTA